jgi:hypothetical protein
MLTNMWKIKLKLVQAQKVSKNNCDFNQKIAIAITRANTPVSCKSNRSGKSWIILDDNKSIISELSLNDSDDFLRGSAESSPRSGVLLRSTQSVDRSELCDFLRGSAESSLLRKDFLRSTLCDTFLNYYVTHSEDVDYYTSH